MGAPGGVPVAEAVRGDADPQDANGRRDRKVPSPEDAAQQPDPRQNLLRLQDPLLRPLRLEVQVPFVHAKRLPQVLAERLRDDAQGWEYGHPVDDEFGQFEFG